MVAPMGKRRRRTALAFRTDSNFFNLPWWDRPAQGASGRPNGFPATMPIRISTRATATASQTGTTQALSMASSMRPGRCRSPVFAQCRIRTGRSAWPSMKRVTPPRTSSRSGLWA